MSQRPALSDDQIAAVIRAAGESGFSGFGGECGVAAIALNRVLFGNEGTFVGAFNVAFQAQNSLVGHIAVRVPHPEHGVVYWDADGKLKHADDIESWGMLDPEDADYRKRARALGIAWNEDVANEAALFEFDSEAEVLEHFQGSVAEKMRQLQDALLKLQHQASRPLRR